MDITSYSLKGAGLESHLSFKINIGILNIFTLSKSYFAVFMVIC